ncbi:hypothetical protein PINS_up000615 [Pythium insidiosum]|nr:hypothetical protein PINS_up000615 [Pythium insidiosum]
MQNAEAFGFALLSHDSRLRLERFEIWLDRLTPQDVQAMARGAQGAGQDARSRRSLASLVVRVDWRSDHDSVLGLLQLCLGASTRVVELEKTTSDTPSSYLAAILSACPSIEELTCRCRWRETDALEGPFSLDRLKTLRLLRRDESTDLWPADWDADSTAGESAIELDVLRTVISSCRSATLRELEWIPEDGIRGERAALEIAQFCPSLERLVVQGVSVEFVDALAASYERGSLSASSVTVSQWMDSYDPETGCCVPIQRLLDVLASDTHAMALALTELEIGVGQRGECLDPFLVRLLQHNQSILSCRFSLDGLGTELIDGSDVPQRLVPLTRRHRVAFLSALKRIGRSLPTDIVQLCWQFGARVPSRRVQVDITGGY